MLFFLSLRSLFMKRGYLVQFCSVLILIALPFHPNLSAFKQQNRGKSSTSTAADNVCLKYNLCGSGFLF